MHDTIALHVAMVLDYGYEYEYRRADRAIFLRTFLITITNLQLPVPSGAHFCDRSEPADIINSYIVYSYKNRAIVYILIT
jgi:hypothetical protein